MEEKKVSTEKKTAKVDSKPSVVWNDNQMKSLYANATNVVAGREEILMLLGLNQAWQMGQEEVKVDIVERVIMSPFTAKRLAIMLHGTLNHYEAKYGPIDIGLPEASVVTKAKQGE